jgi:signal peptidase I
VANWLRAVGWTAGIGITAALAVRLVLGKTWTIPEDEHFLASLAPTLDAGDTVFLLARGTPGFGDLVRCSDPEDPNKFVIGRIVGLGGDHVELQGRTLTVNGTRYEGKTACPEGSHFVTPNPGRPEVEIGCDEVSIAGGWHYRGFLAHANRATQEPATKVDVKTDFLFLASDDRDFHDDSRDFGTVPAASCRERILFRFWGKGGWTDSKQRMTYIH